MHRTNPGKREREAGKRHRRACVWTTDMGAATKPLKLGRKHSMRHMRRWLGVADSRNAASPNGVAELRVTSTSELPGSTTTVGGKGQEKEHG